MFLTIFQSSNGRAARYYVCASLLFALAVCVSVVPARAQYSTNNAFVEGDVSNDGYGLVTVFYANTGHQSSLTHAGTSFLTVLVNGTSYFTNNPNIPLKGLDPPYPAPATGYLKGGRTFKIGDTIRTDWQPQGPNAYDIIQDVYPVAFPIAGSGQIVIRFSIVNHQAGFLSVRPQYLLDVGLSDRGYNNDYFNDNSPVTTRFGYMDVNWTGFPNSTNGGEGIPPYFIATLLPISDAHFPDEIAEGYCNDSLAPEPMRLMQPSLLAYVQWPEVVTNWTWGYPTTMPSPLAPNINDEALLFQWPGGGADQNDTSVIGSFSFGSAACTPIAFGNLDAMLIHPDHLVWSGPLFHTYEPNHFPVDAVVWNEGQRDANPVTGTQFITNNADGLADGPLQIVSPLPTTNNGYNQTYSLPAVTIPLQTAASFSWEDTVLQNVLVNCSTDSTYNINFSLTAGGIGLPVFLTPCVCPIEVDCEQKDVTPPSHTAHVHLGTTNHCGNYTAYQETVFDSLPFDQGIKTITTDTIIPANASKVTVSNFSPCDNRDSAIITITQIDSLIPSCVYLRFTDCAGNVRLDTQCFDACPPPSFVDTLPPHFRLIQKSEWNDPAPDSSCGFKCSEWVVTDSVIDGLQHDVGLKSVTAINSQNMTFNLFHPITSGTMVDTFSTCAIDSTQPGFIVIAATDAATPVNHTSFDTINYCTDPDSKKPIIQVQPLQITTHEWQVHVTDTQSWDRGLDTVFLTAVNNCYPIQNSLTAPVKIDSINPSTFYILPNNAACPATLDFAVVVSDTFEHACFAVQAKDCAGHVDSQQTDCGGGLSDTFCPTDSVVILGPDSIKVYFSDYHIINGNEINYDEGIDSIYFYNIRNITMIHGGVTSAPHTIHEDSIGIGPPKFTKLDSVILFVTNVLDSAVDSICWDAVDGSDANNGGGNSICFGDSHCWSGIILQDSTPAVVTVTTVPCDSLTVSITDTRPLDRGIDSVWLDSAKNLASYSKSGGNATSLTFDLPVLDPTQSASGHLLVLDAYGKQVGDPRTKLKHTDSLDVWMYKQDLAMKASGIDTTFTPAASAPFDVPVYLVQNDSFPLAEKGLYRYQFTFHLTGSPKLTFLGTKNSPNLPAGWSVTPPPGTAPGSAPYTIIGQGPALTYADRNDTLVYLVFEAQSVTDVEEAQIVIDSDQCGARVTFNDDSIFSGPNFSVELPAPTGNLNGGIVVLKDSCATIVGVNPHPTYLSIAPAIPNPVSANAVIQYTVPNKEEALLILYNARGEPVRTLFDQTLEQGIYQYALDAHELPAATYFLLLQAGGQACSTTIIVTH